MSEDLDRFDRMLTAFVGRGVAAQAAVDREVAKATVDAPPRRRLVRRRGDDGPSVITSKLGPRYVDHAPCPMCGVDRQGIEYHGELMSGAKVHTIAAHTSGMRRVAPGQPRCLGAGMRMVFDDGVWKGLRA